MSKFNIDLSDKPHLADLMKKNPQQFKVVVGSFVKQMETAARHKWYDLPDAIHSSITFDSLVSGVLNAVLTTKELNPDNYAALEYDLHPLSLLSDKRKDFMTDELENYDWRGHFALETHDISQDTIEKIIRKMLYLVRWFDIDTISKALMTSQFPIVDPNDTAKLPFQPALLYQKEKLGDLHVGKFRHDIGAFNTGTIAKDLEYCVACGIGKLEEIQQYKVCPRCNASFEVE